MMATAMDTAMTDAAMTDNTVPCDDGLGGVDSPQNCDQNGKHCLLERIANSDAHFKHQQRGDPDLSHDEKLKIATDLLEQSPSVFLSRFGKYLQSCDLAYFDSLSRDYTIDFYLKEIRKRIDDSKNHVVVRNRRYEAMKKLIEGGDYFSDNEMKSRDPRLYEQMVGQYLSAEEIQQQIQANDLGDGSIAKLLMHHIETIHNNETYARQVEIEDNQMEEEDSSSDEDEMDDDDDDDEKLNEDQEEEREVLPAAEKLMLRHEFESIMQQRFLSGQDKDFDYSTVDDNVEYDSLDIRARDEEEKYFDEDDDYFSETDGELDDEKCDYFTKSCSIPQDKDCTDDVKENGDTMSDPT